MNSFTIPRSFGINDPHSVMSILDPFGESATSSLYGAKYLTFIFFCFEEFAVILIKREMKIF